MVIDYDKVYEVARRLCAERGHNPDVTDLDAIVEDATDLAKSTVSTEMVIAQLDMLIRGPVKKCDECGVLATELEPYRLDAGEIEEYCPDCSKNKGLRIA